MVEFVMRSLIFTVRWLEHESVAYLWLQKKSIAKQETNGNSLVIEI